jgi:hypothetical protein
MRRNPLNMTYEDGLGPETFLPSEAGLNRVHPAERHTHRIRWRACRSRYCTDDVWVHSSQLGDKGNSLTT